MNETETRVPVTALREWASAIRGDWGDIDGRSVKAELNDIADAIDGVARVDWTIERWRDDLSLCPSGEGHWRRHCQPIKTLHPGTPDERTYGCGNEPSEW